ncbi:M23 family metallopeptidase [Candidimonas sp. SYP-B2681]|uniref:M23 family metallopeptidase n=1 Tax=Candidimonas sp. SYP-B2681 TaxID=2497686 RepID=UPI000F87ACD9|nr:M23 family metallopeptidase [Candidimonas sp. SYP-B2681]RTZ47898.1 M23 family metallopeptidase [Candidimonas sp. SYP-B2681]
MRTKTLIRRLALVLGTVLLSPMSASAQGYISRLLNQPVPGGVAVVALGHSPDAPRVFYKEERVMVLRDSDQEWIAIVGVDLKTSPGRQILKVESMGAARQESFEVGEKNYESQHITLKNKSQVNPDPEQTRRFEREYKEQIDAYKNFREAIPSNVVLDRPVSGRLSSPFGLRRFFNGEERNAHSGLDFAVPLGTPIKAPANGVVTIVADYFFNGKTVFIDHGQGFISMYCHLSGFEVKKGDVIERGQIIGRVGATGRATGPHLHWNISLNNARVDPAIFINAFKP